jgi:hypothetical protein
LDPSVALTNVSSPAPDEMADVGEAVASKIERREGEVLADRALRRAGD